MSFYENRHFFHKTPFCSPMIPWVPTKITNKSAVQQRGKEESESANPRGRPRRGDAVATPWRRRDKGWIKVGQNGSHLEKFGHSIDLTHE